MSLSIRNYTASDRDACRAIFISNIPKFFAPVELIDFDSWLDGYRKQDVSADTVNAYFVLEEDGQVLASGGFFLDLPSRQATMTWGMVANDQHGKEYGRQLLLYRIEQIRTIQPDAVIALDTSQYAFRFFEKMGFSVQKIMPNGYAEEMDRYDMLG
jgi:N-acetylglutamate synthase-like GNAT family acetyltransferase